MCLSGLYLVILAEDEVHDITPQSNRARMDDYHGDIFYCDDDYHNSDIFASDDEQIQKEYSSEESKNEEDDSDEEDDGIEENEDTEITKSAKIKEDYDSYQRLIPEAKRQLLDEFNPCSPRVFSVKNLKEFSVKD